MKTAGVVLPGETGERAGVGVGGGWVGGARERAIAVPEFGEALGEERLELVGGEALGGPVPVSTALELAGQIAEALGAAFETWLDAQHFNTDQLRLLHLIKEQIRANAAELTAFESWRVDAPPLSMNGGFERARAVFGGEPELERVLASLNEAVFDFFGSAPDAPRPSKPTN